ncbi:MAG: hypothetical protein M9894_26260 [Planctomycetes bacterium]|nr:hypothetical protein [Planctomycetota bacterium]
MTVTSRSPLASAARAALALATLLLVQGCRAPHYVVVEDDAPLYADAQGDEVLARMRRHRHAPLDARPDAEVARVALTYDGQAGWAERRAVRVFDYLHPVLDDGADRTRAIRRELRELQLAELGAEWSTDDVAAIRSERVLPGMTRTQVEVAWGWPVSVEATGAPGGERWVYRDARITAVRRWVDSPWTHVGAAEGGWTGRADDARSYPAWVTVRVPVTIERVVEFDEAGKVVRVQVRRYLDDGGSS